LLPVEAVKSDYKSLSTLVGAELRRPSEVSLEQYTIFITFYLYMPAASTAKN